MTDSVDDWWQQHLEEYRQDGRDDADLGVFSAPHPGSDDPQDETENWAYKEGFKQRRKELGDNFEWK